MGEVKFTRGPWVSGFKCGEYSDDYSVLCDSDCGWGYVGDKNKCVALVVTKDPDDTELDANIRLIEKAPEMYEMLSNLAKSLDDEYCGEVGEIEDLLKQVRGE